MNLLCRRVSLVWLVLCLIARTCRSTTIRGFDGQNVTLPCKYDRHRHGKCETCWMKGEIPYSGCNAEIIATDGDKVVHQTSSRYQLNGELQKGDVSLTIISARINDSGQYGCRVHVPGWFNDDKYTVHLIIMKGPVTRSKVKSSTPVTVTTDVRGYGTSYGTNSTNTAKHNNTSAPESENNIKETTNDKLPVTAMSVLLILLIVGTAAVFLILKWKRRSLITAEIKQTGNISVISSNSQINSGVEGTTGTVENIYDVQSENEYEQV